MTLFKSIRYTSEALQLDDCQRQMGGLIDVCFQLISRAHKLPFGFDYWFVRNDAFEDSRQVMKNWLCNWKHVKTVK